MEFNDLLRESHNSIWETMQLSEGMGNIKRNPGGKKKREVCQELTGGETRSLLNGIEYHIASLTPGILCVQGVNARRSKVEIFPNSIIVFSCTCLSVVCQLYLVVSGPTILEYFDAAKPCY